jgi:hypothetical protein
MFNPFKSETKAVDKQDSNPLNAMDKAVERIPPEIETDKFTPEEQREIVKMVKLDSENDIKSRQEWLDQRVLDLQHYNNEKPSKLENLDKEEWQSDRNLGMCAATCDIYQATLKATCWNPETIHFKSNEANDVDHKSDLETFTKWAVGRNECNVEPEVDDFIHNRITQGFSCFKVYWEVWYEWVDRKIPKTSKEGKVTGFDVKTEHKRFERGVMENIANVDDLLIPNFGKNIQDLNHIIHIVRLTGEDVIDYGKRNIFTNIDEEKVKKLKQACYEFNTGVISKEKMSQLGVNSAEDITAADLRVFPVDVFEWYGTFTKGNKTEKFRFHVEPKLGIFLAGKPLRKITKTGKYPFAGGALIRRPGTVLGKSLPSLIAPIVNAINNVFNQKSDFQFFENCPFGFYKPDENFQKAEYKVKPGVLFPTDTPNDINIPNLGRSMAWADSDLQFLLQMLERLTGAASFFMQNETGTSGTATRDRIISEKSDVKFSLWVTRILIDVGEAITMLVNQYQDNAPSDLGERVIGEDGRKLFPNLSIETLRGGYDAYLAEDVIAGSKAYEKQLALWGFENLSQTIWMNPQINPLGSWNLVADTWKKMGQMDVERYLPPKPDAPAGTGKEAENEFMRMKQGEVVEPTEKDNVMEHFVSHTKQKQTRYHELDEEYRGTFDAHLFKTFMQYMKAIENQQKEMMADQMAMGIIRNRESGIIDEVEPNGQAIVGGGTGSPVRPGGITRPNMAPARGVAAPVVPPRGSQPIR